MEQPIIDISAYLKDPRLQTYVSRNLHAFIDSREFSPGKDLRWKRSPENAILEAGNYNVNYFIDEFLKITAKQSKLPKAQRDCIVSHVGSAMHALYLAIQKEEAEKSQENGNKEESRG